MRKNYIFNKRLIWLKFMHSLGLTKCAVSEKNLGCYVSIGSYAKTFSCVGGHLELSINTKKENFVWIQWIFIYSLAQSSFREKSLFHFPLKSIVQKLCSAIMAIFDFQLTYKKIVREPSNEHIKWFSGFRE